MIVKVIDREAMRKDWGTPGPIIVITKMVEISDNCPKCGKPRGKPVRRTHYESGQSYSVDCWANECRHIDYYPTVLKEAKELENDKANLSKESQGS